MLIRLPDPSSRASPHPQPECNMVSVASDSFARFDFRSQIIDNCEFFVSKHDVVQVITTKVATGAYVAYAVRSNEKSRDALLCSERCAAVQDTIESLHNKSCEAVQNYITTNGFAYPPDLKKTKLSSDGEDDDDRVEEVEEEDDDDADVASVNSGRSASSTVALSCWNSSDDEAASMTPATSADPHASHEKGQKLNNIPTGYHNINTNHGVPYASNFASKRRSKPPHVVPGVIGAGKPPSPHFGPDDSDDDMIRPGHIQLPPPPRVKPVKTSPKMPHGFFVAGNGTAATSPVLNNTPNIGTSAGNGSGMPMGMGMGMGGMSNANSYRPPPPPPNWSGPLLQHMPPPPMRFVPGPPQVQAPPQQQQQQVTPQYFAHHAIPHAQAPPNPQPVPQGLPRTASLHYKASMPNLSTGASPQNPGVSTGAGNNRVYDVRLTIRWPGRGESKILESARPSVRALQEKAVAYARTHAGAFENGKVGRYIYPATGVGGENGGSGNGNGNGNVTLRACVRKAFFSAGEAYDMSAYRGDDLTKLFSVMSAGGIPRFEIEVEAVPPGLHSFRPGSWVRDEDLGEDLRDE
ncbi:uncharacterized protein GGS22DRAFT_109648 [Annulohypoxylon maeteangense]|uniref:uncharacterized protein n=1 Tax=Annulohypoxylon maeteangense TaxID=1927788 RepID=UPI002008C3F6|nr:uncharacterized protein GGS22DRAFT_109648 [Annulohypoxylon maeteangense]KAI0887455.1 hypothetical protein GGS22DRAFT_109648 [Annulohypoxylon maeteangense]